jgi:guanidinopropionase
MKDSSSVRNQTMKNDPRFQPVDAARIPRFADVATFLRTCRVDIGPEIDVAIVGVPFDMGVNFRSGARHGPAAVREASRIIRQVHPTSGIAPFRLCNVADVGDATVNAHDRQHAFLDPGIFPKAPCS